MYGGELSWWGVVRIRNYIPNVVMIKVLNILKQKTLEMDGQPSTINWGCLSMRPENIDL